MRFIQMFCAAAICCCANGASLDKNHGMHRGVEYRKTDITTSAITTLPGHGGTLAMACNDASRAPFSVALSYFINKCRSGCSVCFGQLGSESVEAHLAEHITVDENADSEKKKSTTNPLEHFKILKEHCASLFDDDSPFLRDVVQLKLAVVEALSQKKDPLYDLAHAILLADEFTWTVVPDKKYDYNKDSLLMLFHYTNESLPNILVVLKNCVEDKNLFTFITCYPVGKDVETYKSFKSGGAIPNQELKPFWHSLLDHIETEKARVMVRKCYSSAYKELSEDDDYDDYDDGYIADVLLFLHTMNCKFDADAKYKEDDFDKMYVNLTAFPNIFSCNHVDVLQHLVCNLVRGAKQKDVIVKTSEEMIKKFDGIFFSKINDIKGVKVLFSSIMNDIRLVETIFASTYGFDYVEMDEKSVLNRTKDNDIRCKANELYELLKESARLRIEEAAGYDVEEPKKEVIGEYNKIRKTELGKLLLNIGIEKFLISLRTNGK